MVHGECAKEDMIERSPSNCLSSTSETLRSCGGCSLSTKMVVVVAAWFTCYGLFTYAIRSVKGIIDLFERQPLCFNNEQVNHRNLQPIPKQKDQVDYHRAYQSSLRMSTQTEPTFPSHLLQRHRESSKVRSVYSLAGPWKTYPNVLIRLATWLTIPKKARPLARAS